MELFGKNKGLLTVFIVQSVCAAFFLADAIADFLGYGERVGVIDTDVFEYIVAIALVIGVAVTGLEIRRIMQRQARMDEQIRVASGAFAEVIDAQFDEWGLTEAERDVALLSIKGLSITEMASLRDTREGTIKAQSNAVYRKAGVSSRTQLLSYFIEELLAEPLVGQVGAQRQPA